MSDTIDTTPDLSPEALERLADQILAYVERRFTRDGGPVSIATIDETGYVTTFDVEDVRRVRAALAAQGRQLGSAPAAPPSTINPPRHAHDRSRGEEEGEN